MDVLDSAIHKTQIDLQVKDRTGYNMDIRGKWSPGKKKNKQTNKTETNKQKAKTKTYKQTSKKK
jgi:hypothetical protein